ncbi:MAG: group II intron reverse transcriptase/maturase [bacterium]|nr:group II intron reverse transcriptase/maturase [bacterium]
MTKRNTKEKAAVRTQGRGAALFGLYGVRRKARKEKEAKFTALLHHMTVDLLEQSFRKLKRDAAAGIDGKTWREYEPKLRELLPALLEKVHSGKYRVEPVKRAYIAKEDGSERALGILALEDKIVQHAVGTILSQIYEADFYGFSYGFRSEKDQHCALDALSVGIARRKINWILDADIQGFFDNIGHELLMSLLEKRIGDKRILRLIKKWLKTGYIENGKRVKQIVGTPQGAVISPILANIFLHYVLDEWITEWRKKKARGDMIIVRYADDFIVGFQYYSEAQKFHEELKDRLMNFKLKLHLDKTRLIEFGRYAESNRRRNKRGKPDTFGFLGFTHMCSKNKRGYFVIRRKTIKKRFKKKVAEIKEKLKKRMHDNVKVTGLWLKSVIIGHQNYYAVPGNLDSVKAFRWQAIKAWLKTLRRRSQKGHITWKRFLRLVDWLIPGVHIAHPFPNVRFDARNSR